MYSNQRKSKTTNNLILLCNSTMMLTIVLKCSQGQDDHPDLRLIMKSTIARGKRLPARGFRRGYWWGTQGRGRGPRGPRKYSSSSISDLCLPCHQVELYLKVNSWTKLFLCGGSSRKPTHVRKKNWFHIRGFNLGGLSSNYVKCACSFNLSLFIYSCQN